MHEEVEKLVETGKLARPAGERLSRLQPGSYCLHKSWGVGQVKSWDLLGDSLTVDLEGKPGHRFRLAFALKFLEPLPDDHILAQRRRDPAELQALAEDNPVELVRRALASHGGRLTLDALETMLKGSVVEESRYRSWWEGVKRKLREHRSFVVPPRRNLPLELRSEDQDPAQVLMETVIAARDFKSKTQAAQALLSELAHVREHADAVPRVLADLEETIATSRRLQPGPVLELIVVRDQLRKESGIPGDPSALSVVEWLRENRDRFGEIFPNLSVTAQKRGYEGFPEAFGDDWPAALLGLCGRLGIRGIGDVARFLLDQKKGDQLVAYLREGLHQRSLTSDCLAWICRERGRAAAPVFDSEMAAAVMNSVERDHYDDEARRVNRMADLMVSDSELIADLLEGATRNQVRNFARRLMGTPVFDELSRRSLLARVVKAHPEVQELVTGSETELENETLVVSWESLERRKQEFEDLVQRRIPENSKEIALARSYGDLRENFEFKAAKEMQAVLMRRKSELEREIGLAQGTDYRGAETSRVSIGTTVALRDVETGEGETFSILGAWDTDLERGVISYLSSTGNALLGHQVGEEVELTGESEGSTRRVRIESIEAYAK